MIIFTVYDISSDRTRRKVAELCLNSGLCRVQKSCFAGTLTRQQMQELSEGCRELVQQNGTDSVFILKICDADFSDAVLMGNDLDVEMIKDEKTALFI